MNSHSLNRQLMPLKIYIFLFLIVSGSVLSFAQLKPLDLQEESKQLFSKNGQLILQHYESKAYQLKPSKAGHMGLRLYRNYQDKKYAFLLLQGILYADKGLNKLVKNGLDSLSIEKYIKKNNRSFKANTDKKRLRKNTLKEFPRYRFMATKILRHVARLDEVGLKHKKHKEFIRLLKTYDFKTVFTNQQMIKAWGAQLANQVYWLKQIGIADYTQEFRAAVKATYPDHLDKKLSKQQFENKIYTLTHIIIAASGYYQTNLEYSAYSDIIDYFRENTSTIIKRIKEDVIIEVGISLLLVDETYPEIQQIKTYINSKIDLEKRMILSESGKDDFAKGEHRNIIAVLLLDWQGCSNSPNQNDIKKIKGHLPSTLKRIK